MTNATELVLTVQDKIGAQLSKSREKGRENALEIFERRHSPPRSCLAWKGLLGLSDLISRSFSPAFGTRTTMSSRYRDEEEEDYEHDHEDLPHLDHQGSDDDGVDDSLLVRTIPEKRSYVDPLPSLETHRQFFS